MEKIALFGKGGIGKSTVTSNLAALLAKQGRRVLVVGCDPKHDTTVSLTGGRQIPAVVDHPSFLGGSARASGLVVRGRLGVDCIEAGGPEPGIGCAGRGISRMGEILEEAGVFDRDRYDVVFFDVLGDVVCGGFAVPLRRGFADKVYIVTSEEVMSLYAANNIAKAVRNYAANGASLCGLIANLRDPGADRGSVSRFAGLIGTRVAAFLPRDPLVRQAEYRQVTAVEHSPDSELAARLAELAREMLEPKAAGLSSPSPLADADFHALARDAFRGSAPPPAPAPAPEPACAAAVPRVIEEEGDGWRSFIAASRPSAPGPFGMAASGRERARLKPAWERGVRQARGLRVGLVGEAAQLRSLEDPGAGGVPALSLLKEMGFGLDLMVYSPRGGAFTSGDRRHRVHRFPDAKTLWCLLRELDCPVVYTERELDSRLTRAGKTPLTPAAFEPGAAGALRTLERILDLCRWPFYRRYADYF